MALPQIRVCVGCKRKFNDFTEAGSDTCPGCLIKPVKRNEPVDVEAVEKALKDLDPVSKDIGPVEPIVLKDLPPEGVLTMRHKACCDCNHPFMPKNNSQKRCETCAKIRKAAKTASVKLDPLAEQPNCLVSDARVILNLLLATGKITQAQVEACKTLLVTLR